ncbi:MAG TPA: CoA transferase [Streptosporangiaceae bacterium]|jgi:crotonobetainyl-CoA:carnitine CoA-transferase CaiB-like acyl-CoA transferase
MPQTASSSLLNLAGIGGQPLLDLLDLADVSEIRPYFRTRYNIVPAGAAAIAAAGLAAADLWTLRGGERQRVGIDAAAAAAALHSLHYLRLDGEIPANPPGSVTGFYPVRDGGWIYLHCEFPNLRDANLAVLGAPADKEKIANATSGWDGKELEDAIYAGGGMCGLLRDERQWNALPHTAVLSALPLLEITRIGDASAEPLPDGGAQPLSGVRVLDFTRVIAGPMCTRTLAEHGADVLQISRADLPDSGPASLDTAIGKLRAFLDLREPGQAATLRGLIETSDVFVQSYRPGALAARGLSPEQLAARRPGIVYVTLSAWGHEGPWRQRRGYDTVVQSVNGFAYQDDGTPALMPVAAQDYISGYLMAYGAMVALGRRAREGGSWLVRVALARTGQYIRQHGLVDAEVYRSAPADLSAPVLAGLMTEHHSPLGLLTHLCPAVELSATPARWARPAVPRGFNPARWP